MMIRRNEQGFVITTTLVVLVTILVIGTFAGLALVKNAWFKREAFEASVDVYVRTPDGTVLGKAVDFDEHETPQVPFVDYDVPNTAGDPANYRVLVGVRDDRFTTRERIYYPDSLSCQGRACIFAPSTETTGNTSINSRGVDEIVGTGGVSYQIATQAGGGPDTRYNYGVGSTNGGLPGQLYRQGDVNCDMTIPDPNQDYYISFWQSQRVVEEGGTDSGGGTNPPCYQELVAEAAETIEVTLRCQGDWGANACCDAPNKPLPGQQGTCPDNIEFPICIAVPNPRNNQLDCNCPPGFADQGNQSGWCCPVGSENLGTGQCQQIATLLFEPAPGEFLEAISVDHPNGGNILDNLINIGQGERFEVNLPINPNDWQSVAVDGE